MRRFFVTWLLVVQEFLPYGTPDIDLYGLCLGVDDLDFDRHLLSPKLFLF